MKAKNEKQRTRALRVRVGVWLRPVDRCTFEKGHLLVDTSLQMSDDPKIFTLVEWEFSCRIEWPVDRPNYDRISLFCSALGELCKADISNSVVRDLFRRFFGFGLARCVR